ncbi:type IV secretion protein Rhs, partial [Endozoicomonas sp. SM1973]
AALSVVNQATNLGFTYDAIGNLKTRKDYQLSASETFDYDDLNRLEVVTTSLAGGTGPLKTEVHYDALGNIKYKSDVGSYGYNGSCNGVTAGPHAVTNTTGNQNAKYCYDKNGNMVSGSGKKIRYTSFDKPDLIDSGIAKTEFVYGPDRARIRRIDSKPNQSLTTYYMGGIYEKVHDSNGQIKHKHYIADVAVVTQTEGESTTKENYLHKDHLGSVVAITDSTGNVIERASYDPWGKKRLTSWRPAPDYTALASNITTRGFTGHENLDAVGLIHMNGRVYDQNLGRFLSADPFIQNPYNSQSLNRYT